MQSKPQLLAWITCDGVHVDPSSGKHTLLGSFTELGFGEFPAAVPFMVWFLSVSDCSPGTHGFRISVGLDPTQLQPALGGNFEARSPLDRINLINELRNFPFSQPGDYSLLIEVDDEPLLATNLRVSQLGRAP